MTPLNYLGVEFTESFSYEKAKCEPSEGRIPHKSASAVFGSLEFPLRHCCRRCTIDLLMVNSFVIAYLQSLSTNTRYWYRVKQGQEERTRWKTWT